MNKNSMLYWYPKIKDLDIPQPKTEFVLLTEKEKKAYYEGEGLFSDTLTERVKKIIDENFKLPVFLRTDETSAKHSWNKTCFLDDIIKLKEHITEITSFSRCCDIFGGLAIEAMVIREFIPMDSKFTAFYGNMPVNPEVRFFIEKGNFLCWHPYWVKEAIAQGDPSNPDWQDILKTTEEEIKNDILLLIDEVKKVAKVFENDGFWSVDFCKAKDGRYFLIDLALGEESWHQKECQFNRTKEINLFEDSKVIEEGKDVIIKYSENPRKESYGFDRERDIDVWFEDAERYLEHLEIENFILEGLPKIRVRLKKVEQALNREIKTSSEYAMKLGNAEKIICTLKKKLKENNKEIRKLKKKVIKRGFETESESTIG